MLCSFRLLRAAFSRTRTALLNERMMRWAEAHRENKLQEATIVSHLLLSSETPPPIAEPDKMATFFVAAYDPFAFSYAIFDMAIVLHTARVLGAAELLTTPSSLFVPPRSLVRSPLAKRQFGEARYALLATVLSTLLHEHDASPRSLAYAAEVQQASCPHLVAFLRGVCLCDAVSHPFAPQAAYVLEGLRSNGFVSPHVFLDGGYSERQRVLMELLLATAVEFGSPTVLHTALQLSRELEVPPEPYALSRQVLRAFAARDRRKLDWALKTRGGAHLSLAARRGWTHNF